MTDPALALYEARFATAQAVRALAPALERHATAELALARRWHDPEATPAQLRDAFREHMAAWKASLAAEQRVNEQQAQEGPAIRQWVEAVAEGR